MTNVEIERKFLVRDDSWRSAVTEATRIRQAYLRADENGSIRIRLRDGRPPTLTIKSKAVNLRRTELEYEVSPADAELMLEMRIGVVIEKVRHLVPYAGMMWEVDVFGGAHAGLVIAEVELTSAQQQVDLPPWVGREVTGDPGYYNSALAQTAGVGPEPSR